MARTSVPGSSPSQMTLLSVITALQCNHDDTVDSALVILDSRDPTELEQLLHFCLW
jgi:hypothetical protein